MVDSCAASRVGIFALESTIGRGLGRSRQAARRDRPTLPRHATADRPRLVAAPFGYYVAYSWDRLGQTPRREYDGGHDPADARGIRYDRPQQHLPWQRPVSAQKSEMLIRLIDARLLASPCSHDTKEPSRINFPFCGTGLSHRQAAWAGPNRIVPVGAHSMTFQVERLHLSIRDPTAGLVGGFVQNSLHRQASTAGRAADEGQQRLPTA